MDKVDQLLEDIEIGAWPPAPSPTHFLSSARRARRQQVARLAATIALAAAFGFGALLIASPERAEPTFAGDPVLKDQTPPSIDTRTFAVAGIIVDVPSKWDTMNVGCDMSTPLGDTIVFENGSSRNCLVVEPEGISSLHVLMPAGAEMDYWISQEHTATSVGDLDALRVGTHRDSSTGKWQGALILSTQDMVLWVESPAREVVDAVLDSASQLPSGQVAVPWLRNLTTEQQASLLGSLGLSVQDESRPANFAEGYVLETRPSAGAHVEQGAQIVVVRAAK